MRQPEPKERPEQQGPAATERRPAPTDPPEMAAPETGVLAVLQAAVLVVLQAAVLAVPEAAVLVAPEAGVLVALAARDQAGAVAAGREVRRVPPAAEGVRALPRAVEDAAVNQGKPAREPAPAAGDLPGPRISPARRAPARSSRSVIRSPSA